MYISIHRNAYETAAGKTSEENRFKQKSSIRVLLVDSAGYQQATDTAVQTHYCAKNMQFVCLER